MYVCMYAFGASLSRLAPYPVKACARPSRVAQSGLTAPRSDETHTGVCAKQNNDLLILDAHVVIISVPGDLIGVVIIVYVSSIDIVIVSVIIITLVLSLVVVLLLRLMHLR